MHEYQRFVQREMNARNWNQNDVARHAGLNRQTISSILKDTRGRLTQLPDSKTIDGLARAFSVGRDTVLAHVALAMGLPVKLERADVSEVSNDELITEMARRLKAGEDNASTPLTRAEGSSAQDDGLGAFGHRDRGDLDHEAKNDGAGDNVHELFTPPPPASETAAYRTRNRDKEEEERSSKRGEEPQDE